MASAAMATFFTFNFAPQINLPHDFNTNFLMLLRWIHFLAGITWIGLLYFFNLVNVPLMKELDPATKGKVMPALMTRALWWFRVSAVVTVLAGLAYWGNIVAADAQNAMAQGIHASSGPAMGTFFLIWTIVWGILYACLIPGKGIFDNGAFIGVVYAVVVVAAAWLFLSLNSHGWESNRLLAIGIGGGIGWVMMLNVWGVIWRIQKRLIQWTRDNAANGTPMPDKAKYMARQAFLCSRANAYLSIPLLFFMGAASHYPMFGK
ncbi:MAG: urate hydroxylase PuuD [Candidatus Sulfotelmatobacter sp.]